VFRRDPSSLVKDPPIFWRSYPVILLFFNHAVDLRFRLSNECAHRLFEEGLFHDVEERLARWILMSGDRVVGNHLPFTQDFVGQMLGTRRSCITVAAGVEERERKTHICLNARPSKLSIETDSAKHG
jgi:hypothetical protein